MHALFPCPLPSPPFPLCYFLFYFCFIYTYVYLFLLKNLFSLSLFSLHSFLPNETHFPSHSLLLTYIQICSLFLKFFLIVSLAVLHSLLAAFSSPLSCVWCFTSEARAELKEANLELQRRQGMDKYSKEGYSLLLRGETDHMDCHRCTCGSCDGHM